MKLNGYWGSALSRGVHSVILGSNMWRSTAVVS